MSLFATDLSQMFILSASKVTHHDPGAGYNNHQHLLSIYYVPGIVLTALCELPHLFLPETL